MSRRRALRSLCLGGRRALNTHAAGREAILLPSDPRYAWPYKERSYNKNDFYAGEWTKHRLHDNSRLLVVDGLVGAGKTEIAKGIADELGMLYMPAFKIEDIFVDAKGRDIREFYPQLPARFRIPDLKSFHANPLRMAAVLQNVYFQCRLEQMLNAQAHILNTGQGVVMERSAHTDVVFVDGLGSRHLLSHEFVSFYHMQRKFTLDAIDLIPHVFIYVDSSVDSCLERIQQRGDPDEMNVVNREFLHYSKVAFERVIRELRVYCRILRYGENDDKHLDTIVDDLINLDLHISSRDNPQRRTDIYTGSAARLHDEPKLMEHRIEVTQKLGVLNKLSSFSGECWVTDLRVPPDDRKQLYAFIEKMKPEDFVGFTEPAKADHLTKWWEYMWRERWVQACKRACEVWSQQEGQQELIHGKEAVTSQIHDAIGISDH